MSVSQTLTVTQESQSISNNTSTIRIKWTSTQSGASWNGYERTAKYWVSVNGGTEKLHTVTYTLPKSTTKTIVNTTLVVNHNSSGNCTVVVRTWMDTDISAGVITKSKTLVLDTIPRKSTLSVSNGTLGTSQTLSVTRKSSSFTHSIKATCGSSTLYIKSDGSTQSSESKHSGTSISFTPPLSWASQNTTGTSVSVTYKITTYNGSTSIGSNSYTKTYAIPSSVKPSCTIFISDAKGYYSVFGSYIKGKSKFSVVVTATTSYGSAIAAYKTTANGTDYTDRTFTTGVIKSSSGVNITAKVTDKRGRSGTSALLNIPVLDYADPSVTVNVHRCNQDGSENDKGAYVKVTFSGTVRGLSNRNTAAWKVKYKKADAASYTTVNMTDYNNVYTVNNAEHIFAADTGSSYDIQVTVTDYFGTITASTSASTAFTLLHFKADGTSIGFGKVAENSNAAEFGLPIYDEDGNKLVPPTFVTNSFTTYTNQEVAGGSYVSSTTFDVAASSPGTNYQLLGIVGHSTSNRHIRPTTWYVSDVTNKKIYIGYHNDDTTAITFDSSVRLLWGRIG